jgi:hypothetical protein
MNETQQVELKCGHHVVFTVESLKHNGYPYRWWCPVCRSASDVSSDRLAGKIYLESQ